MHRRLQGLGVSPRVCRGPYWDDFRTALLNLRRYEYGRRASAARGVGWSAKEQPQVAASHALKVSADKETS